MVKDADRRKRDQREGRQRGGRGVLGDFASDQAACRACEQVLENARADGRGSYTPWRDLSTKARCAISAALSSLLMARRKEDTDKALEALKTLGKLKRAAPPTPPPLVYDIPDVLQAQVCGVYVTPGSALDKVVDGAPRKKLRVVAKLNNVKVEPPSAIVPRARPRTASRP